MKIKNYILSINEDDEGNTHYIVTNDDTQECIFCGFSEAFVEEFFEFLNHRSQGKKKSSDLYKGGFVGGEK